MGDVVSLWGDVMSTPLGDVTSGDAMSLHTKEVLNFALKVHTSTLSHR